MTVSGPLSAPTPPKSVRRPLVEEVRESWVKRLSSDLGDIKARGYDDHESRAALLAEVYGNGPVLFRRLADEARMAAIELGLHFDMAANWFNVKNDSQPFRMLQAILVPQSAGISLVYTVGSLIGGRNPKQELDFVDLRIQPPTNALIMLHQGTPVSSQQILESMFRTAFVPVV